MISMLICSCRQNEITLLEKISRDSVALSGDERLEVTIITASKDIPQSQALVDVALVDITQEDGINVAKSIRAQYANAEILIISDSSISPMAYLTPDIRAASLLLKPLQKEEAQKVIRELFAVVQVEEKKEDFFWLEDRGEKIRIPYSEILYFEARSKRIYVRIQNTEYGMYGVLDALSEILPEQFRRCHRSYIVNTQYIQKVRFSENRILLKEEVEVPLSRSYKADIKGVITNG